MAEYEFDKSRIFYNTILSYDGGSTMRVLMTDFKYSYSMTTNSTTARTFKTIYPKFFRQSSPSATFQFVNTEELRKFVEWVGEWQQAAISKKKGTAAIKLKGVSSLNRSTAGSSFDYTVLIKSVKYNRSYDTNAPSVTVELVVLDDQWNKSYTGSLTSKSGSLAKNREAYVITADYTWGDINDSTYSSQGGGN